MIVNQADQVKLPLTSSHWPKSKATWARDWSMPVQPVQPPIFVNRPFSCSWTESYLQLKLIRGVFSNANDINLILVMFQRTSLDCKLVPVQCREYEYLLLCFSIACQWDLLVYVFVLIYLKDCIDHINHSFIWEFLVVV